jgi:ABC-type multidrug transport system fused ATPase/permease subunit
LPLNENEERILAEIERQFHASDPDSARRLSNTTLKSYLARNCKLASLGFVVGLVILVAAFAFSWVLAVVGFLIMLASAVALIQNLRKFSRLGLEQVSRSIQSRNLNQSVEDLARRLRRRLGGEERD